MQIPDGVPDMLVDPMEKTIFEVARAPHSQLSIWGILTRFDLRSPLALW